MKVSSVNSRTRIDSKEVLVFYIGENSVPWPYLVLITRRGAGVASVFKCFTCDGLVPVDFDSVDSYTDAGNLIWSKVRDPEFAKIIISEVRK